jgi:excisionase family DNA binding protein
MDASPGPSHDGRSLTLTIPQAAELLGISKSMAYEAARCGELPTICLGSRVLVSRRRLEEMIDGPRAAEQRHEEDAPPPPPRSAWIGPSGYAREPWVSDRWNGRSERRPR